MYYIYIIICINYNSLNPDQTLEDDHLLDAAGPFRMVKR